MKTPLLFTSPKLSLSLALLCAAAVFQARGGTVFYAGTNGSSASTNWSDTANWFTINTTTHTSPANNEANFNGNTGVSSSNLITLNVDGPYPGQSTSGANSGSPQTWGMFFTQTNGYQNIFIQPGIILALQAANGTTGGGNLAIDPAGTNNGGSSSGNTPSVTYTNYVSFSGIGGEFYANTATMRLEGQCGVVTNHYTIWDMSGLGTYVFTNTSAASQNFYCSDGGTRGHVLVYLARTNFIAMAGGGQIHIGNLASTSSNSQPIGMYLGTSNYIVTGSSSSNLLIGGLGCSNGFLKFNPAFVGGATAPTAYISGLAGNQNAAICSPNGGASPGSAVADFTGGNITWIGTNLVIGTSGSGAITANGALTFDNGVVTFNTIYDGYQAVSNGAAAVGTINVNANSMYGTNGTLVANTFLILGAANGTVNAGTTGILNINGGALTASSVRGGSGTSVVDLTNATWNVGLSSTSATNMIVNTVAAGGTTNLINITSVSPLALGPLPIRFHLIAAANRSGYNTFGLAPLSGGLAGYIDTTTTPGVVDFVLTADPNAPRVLTWTGTNAAGTPTGNWDIGSTTDWETNGIATFYNDGDFAQFNDITGPGMTSVTLTTTLSPFGIVTGNNTSTYTLAGGGALAGNMALTMNGSGTLIIDNSSPNTFTGGVTINQGTLQLGNGDTGGSLYTNAIADNSVLAVDRTDSVTLGNVISGTGGVVEEGGATLKLTGANSFTNNATAINSSTLQAGGASAFGSGSGTISIASGSTYDPNGFGTAKSITVSGTGVGGNGAIVNSGGTIGDSTGGLTPMLVIAGDTTLSYPTRWDLGSSTGAVLTNNGLGSSLTLNGGASYSYFEWRDLKTDPALANINVVAGYLGLAGSTSLGNPSATLNIAGNNCGLKFYNDDGFNVNVTKQIVLNDGGLIQDGGGANTINGGLYLSNSNNSQYCNFDLQGASLTVNSTVTGNGILYMDASPQPATGSLIINGDASGFTGGAEVTAGMLVLNSTMGSSVTVYSGGSLSGTGTAQGLVDCAGPFYPGGSNAIGTFTAAAGLTLEGSSVMTLELTANNATGGSNNDLVAVTGDLTLNNNTVNINPVSGSLAAGAYTIMTYTGNLNGTLGNVQTSFNSPYSFTVDTSVHGQVRLMVSGSSSNLVWNNGSGNGQWDIQVSQNWTNQTSQAEDVFTQLDFATFDDSILTAANPTTTVTIPSGTAVVPAIMTNNSTTNYTITGAGKISGPASIVKLGISTLTLNTTNDFTGNITILGGTVTPGLAAGLGSTSSPVIASNAGTLNINGLNLGTKPVYASGAGAGGSGAIVNNGAQQFSALRSVYLTGDTTFGGPGGATPWVIPGPASGLNRWDIRSASLSVTDSLTFLSTSGQNYKLTKTGSNQMSFVSATVDPNLGDLDIVGGNLSFQFLSTMGSPTNTCTIEPNGLLDFYSCSSVMNKKFVFNGDGATIYNENNTNTMVGPITLNGSNVFYVSGTALILNSNAISGTGSLNKLGAAPLFDGDTNSFTGDTVVATGQLALVGANQSLASTHVIVNSGASIDMTLAAPQSLTIASGQYLEGSGTIYGTVSVASGGVIVPGGSNNIGTLTITNTLALAGTTVVDINASTLTNDVIAASGSVGYGGVLNITTLAGSYANGNSFKLFNSGTASYSGSFASILPSTPGAGLSWDTSQLNVSGTLRVVTATVLSPATFGPSTVIGTNLTLNGTGGTKSGTYHVYSSTNLTIPLQNWNPVGSGSFDTNGNFSFGTSISSTNTQNFFILKEP